MVKLNNIAGGIMRRTLILKIEYDGTDYAGWQRQKNATSIQSEIERGIYEITGAKLIVIGAGRTDAGVHSRGQVANCKLNEDFSIPEHKIPNAINSKLRPDIRIKRAMIADFHFNARFDAIAREYSYSIIREDSVFSRRFTTRIKYPFSFDKLEESAQIFKGIHDFTTFSKHNPDTKNSVCNVKDCQWRVNSDIANKTDVFQLKIIADRFIYGMVRSLAGAMLDVARNKRTLEDLSSALLKRDRRLSSPLAPPEGLILEGVYYPERFNDYDFFSESIGL